IGHVVWVHAADLPRGAGEDRRAIRDDERGFPADSGRIDVAAFLGELAARGYDGPVTVETRSVPASAVGLDERGIARRASESLRRCWPRPARGTNPSGGGGAGDLTR